MVWGFDHEAGQWRLGVVEATPAYDYEGLLVAVTLERSDGSRHTVEATGNHPFWVESGVSLGGRPTAVADAGTRDGLYVSPTGGRYVPAEHLRLGDRLLAHEFHAATVVGLQVRNERLRVYNLTVERLHNYAVGEHGVLVHNVCGTEVFYRTMSKSDAEALMAGKKLMATYETFISPSKAYASGFNGVLVKLVVKDGTTKSLAKIGVRDGSSLVRSLYPKMLHVTDVNRWTRNHAYFKQEGQREGFKNLVNIGLGRGRALDIFNRNILSFEIVIP